MALDRGSTEALPGPAIPSSAGGDGSLTTRREGAADRYCIQVAVRNIRHRFGGHLRAARMRDPSAVIRPSHRRSENRRLGGCGRSARRPDWTAGRVLELRIAPGGFDR